MTGRRDGVCVHLAIITASHPRHEAKELQDLRLDAQREGEAGDDTVDAEGDAGEGPQEHHGGLQPILVLPAVVDDDLRDELRVGCKVVEEVGTEGKEMVRTWTDQEIWGE